MKSQGSRVEPRHDAGVLVRRLVRSLFWDGESYPARAKVTVVLLWLCGPAAAFGVVAGDGAPLLGRLVGVLAALLWTGLLSMALAIVLRDGP